MFHTCKVTVIQKRCNIELVKTYVENPQKFSLCNKVSENQEFIISNPYEMPDGICAWAWADIRPQLLAIASGGTSTFLREKSTAVATCTDPFRPVLFKIERIEQA